MWTTMTTDGPMLAVSISSPSLFTSIFISDYMTVDDIEEHQIQL